MVGRGHHRIALKGALLLVSTWLSAAETGPPPAVQEKEVKSAYESQIYPLLKTYCLTCHGPEKHKGDINLGLFTTGSSALFNQPTLKHCVSKLMSREMPPEKEHQPTDEERKRIAAWFASVRRLGPRDPGPGTIRRLSRVEYANTLHDLLGVDPAVAAELPGDVVGAGFSSSISPLLMEKYLLIADEVLDQLIRPGQMQLKWNAGQLDAVINGKPDAGKDAGLERHFVGAGQLTTTFPAPTDGTYTIRIRAASERIGKEPLRLAVRCGNQVLGELKITAAPKTPATYSLTGKLPAGKTNLTLIIANAQVDPSELEKPKPLPPVPGVAARPPSARAPAKPPTADKETANDKESSVVRSLLIETVEITGPPGAQPTDIQRKLFVAMPDKDLSKRDAARRIAESFVRRAFRRPADADEIEVLMKVFDLADSQDEVFAESVKLMLKGILMSPQFLFISAETKQGPFNEIVPIGDHQLAARLSYLFWATMPDDELAALADAGTLRQPDVLIKQVRRLIADPRSGAFFDGFGAQWLGLDKLETLPFDEKKFPLMTKELRRAMYDEAAMLFATVLREDRSLLDLLDVDFTFVNAALAKIYGMEGEVKGAQMRRVQLTNANRGGILTMPGVLAVTSLPNRTSPVKRGKWVLEQVFGQAAPTPPMNVATLEQQDTPENAALNLRQRTERHRHDPACAGCHRVLDVIGFGLENFDPIGRWRDQDDTGLSVDASGELPGRIAFRSPSELKRIIAARKDEVCRALVGKLLAYTLCRSLEGYDEVVADDIANAVAKDGYKLQTALVLVATSYPMLNRRINR